MRQGLTRFLSKMGELLIRNRWKSNSAVREREPNVEVLLATVQARRCSANCRHQPRCALNQLSERRWRTEDVPFLCEVLAQTVKEVPSGSSTISDADLRSEWRFGQRWPFETAAFASVTVRMLESGTWTPKEKEKEKAAAEDNAGAGAQEGGASPRTQEREQDESSHHGSVSPALSDIAEAFAPGLLDDSAEMDDGVKSQIRRAQKRRLVAQQNAKATKSAKRALYTLHKECNAECNAREFIAARMRMGDIEGGGGENGSSKSTSSETTVTVNHRTFTVKLHQTVSVVALEEAAASAPASTEGDLQLGHLAES